MATVDTTFTRRRVLRGELIGLYGVVERNIYLTRRYLLWDLAFLLWTIANTLTIVFIARGVDLSAAQRNELETKLLVGGVIWAFLGIIFEIVTETVAWERWEGTIEYTFMAPVSRLTHMLGTVVFGVVYGLLRTAVILAIVTLFFDLDLSRANLPAAALVLVVASIGFVGLGMMVSTLPLLFTERGQQMVFVSQSCLLLVSGVYYPVEVMPTWMQAIGWLSPATYALIAAAAALPGRRRHDPARAGGVPVGRAVRQEDRTAETKRLTRAK